MKTHRNTRSGQLLKIRNDKKLLIEMYQPILLECLREIQPSTYFQLASYKNQNNIFSKSTAFETFMNFN